KVCVKGSRAIPFKFRAMPFKSVAMPFKSVAMPFKLEATPLEKKLFSKHLFAIVDSKVCKALNITLLLGVHV
ncbi:MAG: hypothetical protein SVW51_10340, partial [Pseudomonadota bacterium]|nr:hypothetical protein [Pseudomonadota bacterium]